MRRRRHPHRIRRRPRHRRHCRHRRRRHHRRRRYEISHTFPFAQRRMPGWNTRACELLNIAITEYREYLLSRLLIIAIIEYHNIERQIEGYAADHLRPQLDRSS